MDLARQLYDIEQIKQLKHRYFRFLDAKDWVNYRTVFTDDFHFYWENETEPLASSGDGYVALATRYYPVGAVTTIHHGQNPEIEITGPNSARGTWALWSQEIWSDGRPNRPGGGSRYFEEYERGSDGRWRIRRSREYARAGAVRPEAV